MYQFSNVEHQHSADQSEIFILFIYWMHVNSPVKHTFCTAVIVLLPFTASQMYNSTGLQISFSKVGTFYCWINFKTENNLHLNRWGTTYITAGVMWKENILALVSP